jgi:hypothetical protein
MQRMQLQKYGLIVATLAGAAAFVVLPHAKADTAGSVQLKTINIECVLPGSLFTTGPGTCKGDLIDNAQIVDVATGGTTLGSTTPGNICYLDASTDTLTTTDGSTLVFTTVGTSCYSGGINIRHNAYQITGGTGRFAGAGGAGNFVVATSSPTTFAIHINGNIQF